ncbi:HAMP domain-containing histidine kinase [Lusitaniella coriacea LEGE 07157]|uniref:histidine kinase n=1 Tax=Lusitaniella coriacea LEGE 07157 TaxID=945747 RepID=A0A8J7B2D0_9CYAN|nr:HAMP domain-containing sensor histidine kinase [Lusitaniella coriacea]MBE9114272.1 HAMP domain-containing histidine kinase [Lusitaniella coriacea LEGE 07157]
MGFLRPLRSVFYPFRQSLDPLSLRIRLTLGIASVSAIGVGAVTLWTGGRMQHILISTHKQNIEYIADRFPQDFKIYRQMKSEQEALQKAVDNLTTGTTLLWVKNPEGKVIAESEALEMETADTKLMSLPHISLLPEIERLGGRYWVMCGAPLVVDNVRLGKVMLAQDITSEQVMLNRLLWSLGVASLLSVGAMTVAIAIYVQRSLQPLERMSQITEQISPERFESERLHLDRAPTEVKQLAQTLDRTLARLHAAWEQQRQFVSNVSHELRTPLTIVSGYLQSTLRRGTNLSDPQREALSIAASEAERTIQLLEDLLDLARVDSGHLRFQLQPLILNDLAEEVVGMAKQHSNRTIQLKTPECAIAAVADPNRLKQVLLNLIDNAVKYSDPEQPITLKLDRANQQTRIQVCDRGPGIALTDQSRIFERFYRVDEARFRSTGGTGLGLSIVKTLVEGMGGQVSVRSKPGDGSVFTVILPCCSKS